MSEALRFGVIGQNISYSKSGEIFQVLFDRAGVSGRFDIVSIDPNDLESTLQQLTDDGFSGISVTIPLKEMILDHLHEVDPIASKVRAVNSVFVENGKLSGTNTDCFGVSESLRAAGVFGSSGKVMILGCGGAARAAMYSLVKDFGVKDIVVVGRSEEKLSGFVEVVGEFSGNARVQTATYDTLRFSATERFAVVVNCTPLGGWNYADMSPLPSGFDWVRTELYFDMNYNTGNAVINDASAAGRTVIDGSAMLVAQAVKSFEIWTGQKVDWRAVHKELF